MKIYTLNAFSTSLEGGNPAGVCLNCNHLSENEMLKIAREVGFSETAFVMNSKAADFRVRFFTPALEVDLCGHATIATFSLLKDLGLVGVGTVTMETKAGILNIEVTDEQIMMDQTLPEYGETIEKNLIAQSLNITETDMIDEIPVQVVSTGLKDIIVPIKSLNILNNIKPNFELIRQISSDFKASGYHLFTTETILGGTAHCRNFAPLCDIDEEAATGTATGATSSYMFHHNLLKENQTEHLIFEQGYSMNRPSEICAALDLEKGEITRVRVGGTAVRTGELDL